MNQCNHDFKTVDTNGLMNTITVVCVYCGQVRRVFPSGHIEVIKESGEVTRRNQQTHGQIQDKNSTGNVKL